MPRTILSIRAALLVLTLLGTLRMTPAQHVAAQHASPLDLAAMVVTPDDLDSAGFEAYGNDQGEYRDQRQIAQGYARDEGEDLEDAIDLYQELGLLRSYSVRFALPIEGGTYSDETTEGLWVNMLEFDTRADAVNMLRGTEELDREDGHEFIANAPQIGDSSYVNRSEDDDRDSGEPAINLYLQFTTDNYAVLLNSYDVARDGEAAHPTEPDVNALVEIAKRQLERIESAADGDLPDLGLQVVRLTDDDGIVQTVGDRYYAMDGAPLRRFADSDESLASRADHMDAEGTVASYGLEQMIQPDTDADPGAPYVSVRLYQFEDDDAATSWINEIAFDRFSTDPYIQELSPLDLEIDSADMTIAGTYVGSSDGTDVDGIVVWIQVEQFVARLTVDAATQIASDVIEELAAAQIDCLTGSSCDPIQVPSGLSVLM